MISQVSPLGSLGLQFTKLSLIVKLVVSLFIWTYFQTIDDMHCVDMSKGQPIPDQLKYVCQQNQYASGLDGEQEKVRPWAYLSFWGYALLMLAALVVLLAMEMLAKDNRLNSRHLRLNYGTKTQEQLLGSSLMDNLGSFASTYTRSCCLHFYALLIGILDLALLYVMSSGTLWELISLSDPSKRDYVSDTITAAFPPFTRCRVEPNDHILGLKTVVFGCYNMANPIYEKTVVVFTVITTVMLVVVVASLLWLVLVLGMCANRTKRHYVRCGLPSHVQEKIVNRLSRGDCLTLHWACTRVRGHHYLAPLKNLYVQS